MDCIYQEQTVEGRVMLKLIHSQITLLQDAAQNRAVETCAAGLIFTAKRGDGLQRYIVRDLVEVPAEAYLERTSTSAILKPEFCMGIANRARAAGAGVFLAHTHPGLEPLEGFSITDNAGEAVLSTYFRSRLPNAEHFAAVITRTRVHVRVLGQGASSDYSTLGVQLRRSVIDEGVDFQQFDRQVRALGEEGQKALTSLTVAIVGVGGTGSVVAQQLAYLGVRSFVLIDPDTVETTNLHRLVGGLPGDVGKSKTEVIGRVIRAINPEANVLEIVDDVTYDDVAQHLEATDFIFGCTDSMASRAVINQFSYQYLVPYIDVGVGIYVQNGQINYITGRIQMLSPGLPCLVCTDKLDAEQVRRELLTDEARRRDPYIVGETVPQPAVVSLNSTVSSSAVSMFLSAVCGFGSTARTQFYDGMRGTLRPAEGTCRKHCIVCSHDGALARGTSWNLPTRKRERNG